MKQELLRRLEQITEEETEILKKHKVEQRTYTDKKYFEITSHKLLDRENMITVRVHTRFVEFPEHSHDYIEMMYVCQGSVTHVINGKEIVMEEGDLLLLNQYVRHSIQKAEKRDIGINIIARSQFFEIPLLMAGKDNVLANFLVDALRQNGMDARYLLFKLKGRPEVENIMENMIYSIMNKEKNIRRINQISMGLVFMHILNHLETLDASSACNYREVILQTTHKYINEHYRDANLSQLALEMNQSLPTLSKMIKMNFGCTFQEMVQRKKLQQAVMLLMETQMPIADIIPMVGYENSSYFYKKFREKYGISPKEYREQHKGDKEIRL